MEWQTRLIAFGRNHVKLAWAFMNIMNAVHHCEIFHNDFSKDIMLHFPCNKSNVVYIGMCNWDEVGCMHKVTPSLYFLPKNKMPLT